MDSKVKKIKRELILKRRDVKNKLDLLKHGELIHENFFSPITKHLKDIEIKLNKKKVVNNDDDDDDDYKDKIFKEISSPNKKLQPFYQEFENPMESPFIQSTPKQQQQHKYKQEKSSFLKQSLSSSIKKRGKHSMTDNNDNGDDPSTLKMTIINQIKSDEENNAVKGDESDLMSNSRTLSESFNNEISEKSFQDYLDQYESLPRTYIEGMITDSKNYDFDHKYGVRHDPTTEKFYIGNSQLYINGSDIVVKNKTYKGTHGLYELLFKKDPKFYTEDDERAYKEIVLKTNAHKRYYLSNKQVDGSKLRKYKDIIAPFVKGEGMFMEVSGGARKIDYIHWDDPNELVERLKLLLASQKAGHTGHCNEINSIIEELREAKIIK